MEAAQREREATDKQPIEEPWVPGPGSVLWERGGDMRLMLVAGRSLLLQVTHKTVAAGVAQHSNYATDPWGRLRGTLDLYVAGVNFGWPDGSLAAAQRLRRMHRKIEGVDADGNRYHALDPEAFAWVHTTLVDGFLLMLQRYIGGVSDEELDQAYDEMRMLGKLYGVPDEYSPPDRRGHEEMMQRTVEEKLVPSDVALEVLDQLSKPPPPDVLKSAGALWRIGMVGPARITRLATVGDMPEPLRSRLGLTWSEREQRELDAYSALARRTGSLMPDRVRLLPKVYAAKRQRAVAA